MTIAEQVTQLKTDFDEVKAAGIAEGKQAEYDAFWDTFQDSGNRAYYQYSFAGAGWTPDNFKPKYDMAPVFAGSMFSSATKLTGSLPAMLEAAGVTLTFEKATSVAGIFTGCALSEIGELDLDGSNSIGAIFQNCSNLVTVKKLKVRDMSGSSGFLKCSKLQNIIIEGNITGSTNLSQCPLLTHDSIMSFVNALTETTSTGKKLTLGSENIAKLTAEELSQIEAKGWTYA